LYIVDKSNYGIEFSNGISFDKQ